MQTAHPRPRPMHRRYRYGLTALLLAPLALILSACGGDGDGTATQGAPAESAAVPGHVHGLAVDPGDGSLRIATHEGLLAPTSDGGYERIGTSSDDFMGFAIDASDSYLASGHPAEGAAAPPHLGLIRSTDGGRSWKAVSLRGQADFHVLRAAGERVYGFDGLRGQLLASADGGETWQPTDQIGAVLDLAIDPVDELHLLAATENGLRRSLDGGESWKSVDGPLARLAWSTDAVFLFEASGTVLRGMPGGPFERVGRLPEVPVAVAAGGSDGALYAISEQGKLRSSDDQGQSWSPLESS